MLRCRWLRAVQTRKNSRKKAQKAQKKGPQDEQGDKMAEGSRFVGRQLYALAATESIRGKQAAPRERSSGWPARERANPIPNALGLIERLGPFAGAACQAHVDLPTYKAASPPGAGCCAAFLRLLRSFAAIPSLR
jgi:hypothetical protein